MPSTQRQTSRSGDDTRSRRRSQSPTVKQDRCRTPKDETNQREKNAYQTQKRKLTFSRLAKGVGKVVGAIIQVIADAGSSPTCMVGCVALFSALED